MPYVTQEERDVLDPTIQKLFDLCEQFRGRINYCVTKLVHLWTLKQMDKISSLVKKYDILNDAYGIMCSAAAEFYAAVVVPYEKLKREENSPVSQLDATDDGHAKPLWQCKKCLRIFKDSEVVEVCGHETYYQCPNKACNADSANWEQINKNYHG